MENIFRRNPDTPFTEEDANYLIDSEWLVTNALGGYASGTLGGAITRGFHGYLIASLPSPLGRTMMLNDVFEHLILPDGHEIQLKSEEKVNEPVSLHGSTLLAKFSMDLGLPVWTYEVAGMTIEKRVILPHRQNTVFLNYRVTSGNGKAILRLRPSMNVRNHEAPVNTPIEAPYTLTIQGDRYEIQADPKYPPLRMLLIGQGGQLTIDRRHTDELAYRIERSRGYASQGDLWSPGYLSTEIGSGEQATLIASVENWDVVNAMTPQEAWDAEYDRRRRLLLEAHPNACNETCKALVLSADQFIITPTGRREDTARARAAGNEIRSVIAGYHWFTDWGRDTMIGLEGLTLVTGRQIEAAYILRTFAHYIRDGLIPNMFPEGRKGGLYHTADATLWFFHALHRYLLVTKDRHLLGQMLPKLMDIVGHHLRGTRFGIYVDPNDGLLSQGQDGYQLTWMDAKVDDWVVTPRHGKAVEINALWYNALRLLEVWLREHGKEEEARGISSHAERARASFNERFWYPEGGYLYDVIDGENGAGPDASLRPNQLFAISLDHPILDRERWESVLHLCKEKLLTPVGLRSLAPGSPEYKPRYDGDLRSRDAAYHQGTVWAWLIGPFVDAWLRVHPNDMATACRFLRGFQRELRGSCIGTISEIFDADPPYRPRGCAAQAWSVAEVLRCLVKTQPSA
ncbi:MAG TPA: amylo-alpha-1,6-glucosidase [Bryobacteraceae bacterium]|jgi:predicted glycogen debranching enzyme|nr:amylo-alpha-1,6-glucosidase [Bryobacteraceae bacterium]